MIMINEFLDYLDELIPNPRCELNYNKDYELLLAVMLSAQTTDKRVNEVTSVLFEKYDSIKSLASADITDIMNIIKPIGTLKKKASNVILIAKSLIDNNYDYVPNNRDYLESLPGVGKKTINVVLSILYNEPCIAVDTHVSRVSKRLKLASINDDVLVIEKKLMKKLPNDKLNKLHHQILLFGRYYCKARNPECINCKMQKYCREFNKR